MHVRRTLTSLGDAGILLLLPLLLPFIIILIGAPLAILLRLIVELIKRL